MKKKCVCRWFCLLLAAVILAGCGVSGPAKTAAVIEAENAIDGIGTVTLDSRAAIRAARELVDALTEEEQRLVGNLETLQNAEKQYGNTLYKQVAGVMRMTLDEAWRYIGDYEGKEERLVQLRETVESLRQCKGVYSEPGSNYGSNKATVDYYLCEGAPWMTIIYTNYRGSINDCKLEPSPDSAYQWLGRPTGKHANADMTTEWIIKISPDKIRVDWTLTDWANDPSRFHGYDLTRNKN